MRSNALCPICASGIRDKIDKVLEKEWTEETVLQKIDQLVHRQKRKTKAVQALFGLTLKEFIVHEMDHRRFGPRQQFQQPTLANGDVLELIDFSQLETHTPIATGVTGLTFRKCRLENCDLPKDAKCVECHPTHKSYCSHINPRLRLTPCASDCQHVVSFTPEVVIEGRVVLRNIYHYRNLPVK